MTERYGTTRHGWFIVLDLKGKRGDILRHGDQVWPVLGVETWAMPNPKPPFAFLVGFQIPPEVGWVLTIERQGELATAQAELSVALRRIAELESDRSRLDNLLAHAYRGE